MSLPVKLIVSIAVAGGFAAGCDGGKPDRVAMQLTGGNPERASAIMHRYGCGSCHTVSGVVGARGQVGPPLAGVANRQYLAGMLPNTPENMIRWIRHPQEVSPGTAMPNMGVTEREARDVAAYLYSQR